MNVLLLETQDAAWFQSDLTGAGAAAGRLAERVGLGGHRAAEVVLAVSETASHLVENAVTGAIVLRIVRSSHHTGVEFLALTGGPGMSSMAAVTLDGRSATGTPGSGLDMTARLADAFDLRSVAGQGTVALARFWPRDAPSAHPDACEELPEPAVQGVTRPIKGMPDCGDGWAARLDEARTPASGTAGTGVVWVMLCDGLGHGPLAHTASQAAIHTFRASRGPSPADVVRQIHHRLAGPWAGRWPWHASNRTGHACCSAEWATSPGRS